MQIKNYNKFIEQFLKFYENKDHFIDKLSINDELKNKYKSFFKSHSNLENQINWQNKDLNQISIDIENLINITKENSIKNKERRNVYKQKLQFGKDWKIYKETENWIYAMPFSYEACKQADSTEFGGQGARWCVGWEKDDHFFYDYFVDYKSAFLFCFNKKCQISQGDYQRMANSDTINDIDKFTGGCKYMIEICPYNINNGSLLRDSFENRIIPQGVIDKVLEGDTDDIDDENDFFLCINVWNQIDESIIENLLYTDLDNIDEVSSYLGINEEVLEIPSYLTELGSYDIDIIYDTYNKWRKNEFKSNSIEDAMYSIKRNLRIVNTYDNSSFNEFINKVYEKLSGGNLLPVKNKFLLGFDRDYYYFMYNERNSNENFINNFYQEILENKNTPDSLKKLIIKINEKFKQLLVYNNSSYKDAKEAFEKDGTIKTPFFAVSREYQNDLITLKSPLFINNEFSLKNGENDIKIIGLSRINLIKTSSSNKKDLIEYNGQSYEIELIGNDTEVLNNLKIKFKDDDFKNKVFERCVNFLTD